MSTPLDDFIDLAEHLDGLSEPWAGRMAIRANRFLSGKTDDVAAALDLKVARGKRPLRVLSEVAARNRVIREAAETFFPGMKPKQQGDELAAALRRYATSAWRSDRLKQECPYKAGDLRAALWLILTRVDHPLSAERIRKILARR